MIAKRKARRKEPTGIYNKVRTAEVKKKSFVCVSLSPQKKEEKIRSLTPNPCSSPATREDALLFSRVC